MHANFNRLVQIYEEKIQRLSDEILDMKVNTTIPDERPSPLFTECEKLRILDSSEKSAKIILSVHK
jgi:hypothetical protein